MHSTWEFLSLMILGLLCCILGVGLADPKPIKGAMAMLAVGLPLFVCGRVAVSVTRPPKPPTNLMQWWVWKVETLPALPRIIVCHLLQILGLGLMALSVVWMVEGPISSVARRSESIGAVSCYVLFTLAIVLRLRQSVGEK